MKLEVLKMEAYFLLLKGGTFELKEGCDCGRNLKFRNTKKYAQKIINLGLLYRKPNL